MKIARFAIIAFGLSILATGVPNAANAARCTQAGPGAPEIAAARARAQEVCGCPTDDSVQTWKMCVRDALAASVASGEFSRSCARSARKLELASTCGRPDRVICCRTNASNRTRASVRRANRCTAPRGGEACVSPLPYKVDACSEAGCNPGATCGDGHVDAGETCDPPDGATCDENCQTLGCSAEGPGTLLACHEGRLGIELAGIDDVFLAVFNGRSETDANLVQVLRFDENATLLDALPTTISQDPGDDATASFVSSSATAAEASFHVGMRGAFEPVDGIFSTVLRRREVPTNGAIEAASVDLAISNPIGACRAVIDDPIGLATGLDGETVYASWRNVFVCQGIVQFETISGVPGAFSAPPPGNISSGPAPLARGTSDVAGLWWNDLVSSLSPPIVARSLRAAWLAPGPQGVIDLLLIPPGLPVSFSPALVANEDVFLAAWSMGASSTSTHTTTLRAMRFTRAGGSLDSPTGLLLVTGSARLGQTVVAPEGTGFRVAYTQQEGSGELTVHTLYVGADGSFTAPSAVATLPAGSEIDLAATSTASFLGYAEDNGNGYVSIRVIRLGS